MQATNSIFEQQLALADQTFCADMLKLDPKASESVLRTGEYLSRLQTRIRDVEEQISPERIVTLLKASRALVAQSAFGKRLQEWPRGYAGDWDTVEWIASRQNRSPPATRGWLLEQHALESDICQQHRNKLAFQAHLISTLAATGGHHDCPKVLLIAAGSGLDVQSVAACPDMNELAFVLNDADNGALEAAEKNLAGKLKQVEFISGNVFSSASQIAGHGPYDLIVMGGLYDYLPKRAATLLLQVARKKWLKAGGAIYFSNLADGNPFRTWMEYLVNWKLIERSEQKIRNIVSEAGLAGEQLSLSREQTGLTWLVVIRDISTDHSTRVEY